MKCQSEARQIYLDYLDRLLKHRLPFLCLRGNIGKKKKKKKKKKEPRKFWNFSSEIQWKTLNYIPIKLACTDAPEGGEARNFLYDPRSLYQDGFNLAVELT